MLKITANSLAALALSISRLEPHDQRAPKCRPGPAHSPPASPPMPPAAPPQPAVAPSN